MTESTQENANPLGDYKAISGYGDNPVVTMLMDQVAEGFEVILEANAILLESDSGTGVREIDKILKEYDGDDEDIKKAKAAAEKAQKAFKTAQEKARNLVRTNHLHEDEVAEADVDKDEVKKRRQMVMDAINLTKQFGETNGLKDVVKWCETLSVPQVGRQGSSTVGQKKPRARVTTAGHIHESFGEAAKWLTSALSDDENKVIVNSNDLVNAWVEAGEPEEFTFHDIQVGVQEKSKKSDD
jgi:hypothetical protein